MMLPVMTILGTFAVDDDNEGSRGAANLHTAATKGRNQKTADDGGEDALRGRNARSDAKCNGQRQGDNADNQAGHEVSSQFLPIVMPQLANEARCKSEVAHALNDLVFNVCCKNTKSGELRAALSG